MTLDEYEKHDLESLIALKSHDDFQGEFGITKLQRNLKIGYNRSSRLQELGVSQGILTRDKDRPFITKFIIQK